MRRSVIFLALCAASAIAQSSLNAPLVGVSRDAKNALHPVYGVAGNFVVRGGVQDDVLDWAFAGHGGFAKTNAELLVLGADGTIVQRQAARGGVVLSPSYAFFPETGELWHGGTHTARVLRIEPAAIGGKVIAHGPDARGITLAVCRTNHLWLLTFDLAAGTLLREAAPGGAIGELACPPAGSAAFMMIRDRMLLVTGDEIVIQERTGEERRIAIPGGATAEVHRFGEDTVQIELRGAPSHLLRFTSPGEEFYELPAAEVRQ